VGEVEVDRTDKVDDPSVPPHPVIKVAECPAENQGGGPDPYRIRCGRPDHIDKEGKGHESHRDEDPTRIVADRDSEGSSPIEGKAKRDEPAEEFPRFPPRKFA
jgi:hypothetical protein